MPWKVSSLLGARQRFIRAALRGVESIAQLCSQVGVSRKTGFKWLGRFKTFGRPGLCDRSRRPNQSPNRTTARWVKAIVEVRRKHPSWGAKKIYAHLRQSHPRAQLPKTRTIADWLKRLGLARRKRIRSRRGPEVPQPLLGTPEAPNDVWTVDFKGWFRTRDGQRVDALTVRDLFSRYILDIRLVPYQHTPVQHCFEHIFTRFGLPKAIRVDHGAPFAGDGALDLSRLSAWWLRSGISIQFTRRGRPQDNGAHEQMHRVYKAEVTSPPAANRRAQQQSTTRWVRYYNEHRPHEALGQRVPAFLYRQSRRPYRRLKEITYPANWRTLRVTASGFIRWHGRLRLIGRAFGGSRIGFKFVSKGWSEVYFERHLIGVLVDTDAGGMRPAQWSRSRQQNRRPA